MGSVLLEQRPSKARLLLPPYEDAHGSRQSTALNQTMWHPDLQLPASRTVSDKFLLCVKPLRLWCFVMGAWTDSNKY